MRTELLSDFTVNNKDKTIIINREFSANIELVWRASTTIGNSYCPIWEHRCF
ncbi:hypothetical protein MMC2321_01120 [Chitinophaga sp. MM2321]